MAEPHEVNHPVIEEHSLPALYMVYAGQQEGLVRAREVGRGVAAGYTLHAVLSEDVDTARSVVELDGALQDEQWSEFRTRILPDGLFVVVEESSGTWVGTASAVHNPQGGRYHFPGGGELGYLVVAEEHRQRGLGGWLVRAAVRRFRSAAYRHIWLGVQGWRLPAIRTYLAEGFVPFLHPPDPDGLAARWRRVYDAIGHPLGEGAWRRELVYPQE